MGRKRARQLEEFRRLEDERRSRIADLVRSGQRSKSEYSLVVDPKKLRQVRSSELDLGDVLYDEAGYAVGQVRLIAPIIVNDFLLLELEGIFLPPEGDSTVSPQGELWLTDSQARRSYKANRDLGALLWVGSFTVRGDILINGLRKTEGRDLTIEVYELGLRLPLWQRLSGFDVVKDWDFRFSQTTECDFEAASGPGDVNWDFGYMGDWDFDVRVTDESWAISFNAVGHSEKKHVARLKKVINHQAGIIKSTSSEANQRDTVEKLLEIARLRESGLISETEFQIAKEALFHQPKESPNDAD